MINELFTLPSTIERLRQGPLDKHLDAYAAVVAEQGYAPNSIRSQIVVIAELSRWFSAETHCGAKPGQQCAGSLSEETRPARREPTW